MSGHRTKRPRPETLNEAVDVRVARRVKAQRRGRRSIWFGLGMFGVVGWSIAVPTLAGIALGLWLDAHWPGRVSWTLTLIFVGVGLGCFNAWRWINRENDND